MIETSTFRGFRVVLGALIALAAHALTFIAALMAGRIVGSEAADMRDLGAIVGTLVVGQALVALACLAFGIVLIVRGKRDLGVGLLVGWLLGSIAGWLVIQSG